TQAAAPRQRWPVRQVGPAAAAARLPGLQGGLLGLPLAEVRGIPRPRTAWLQRGRGQGDRGELDGPRRRPEYRRGYDPSWHADRLLPVAVRQRHRRARGEQQRDSAGPVADDQGAARRRGLRLLAAHRLPGAAGRTARAVPRRQDRYGPLLQPVLPEPEPGDGAAAV